ncbi:hypothetical protein JZ751_010401 [Albula glossodonta]|uniref:Uncharacterized protein n=1 Tax=Albula glossodonta TaxID=121402 RepID=A0A8T2NX39_9TELE|nr:hypothetical protein JZ751_010401 [Albula glossodonta]
MGNSDRGDQGPVEHHSASSPCSSACAQGPVEHQSASSPCSSACAQGPVEHQSVCSPQHEDGILRCWPVSVCQEAQQLSGQAEG